MIYWLITQLFPSVLLKAKECQRSDLQRDVLPILRIIHFLSMRPVFPVILGGYTEVASSLARPSFSNGRRVAEEGSPTGHLGSPSGQWPRGLRPWAQGQIPPIHNQATRGQRCSTEQRHPLPLPPQMPPRGGGWIEGPPGEWQQCGFGSWQGVQAGWVSVWGDWGRGGPSVSRWRPLTHPKSWNRRTEWERSTRCGQ